MNSKSPRWNAVESLAERVLPRLPAVPMITGTKTNNEGYWKRVDSKEDKTSPMAISIEVRTAKTGNIVLVIDRMDQVISATPHNYSDCEE